MGELQEVIEKVRGGGGGAGYMCVGNSRGGG